MPYNINFCQDQVTADGATDVPLSPLPFPWPYIMRPPIRGQQPGR